MEDRDRPSNRATAVALSSGAVVADDAVSVEARARLAAAFKVFDGTDTAYVAYLTGLSIDDLRRVHAL